jgi:hypothetical protein
VTGLTVPSLRPVALRAARLAVVLWLVAAGTAGADDPTKEFSPEIDTNPPPGFETEVRFLLNPIPCPVRAFALPDLFAGRMHAVLGRRWEGPVKGLDWCDLLWFAGGRPALQLSHLEASQGGILLRNRGPYLVSTDTSLLVLGHPADGPHAVASGVEPRPGPAGDRQIIVATPGEPAFSRSTEAESSAVHAGVFGTSGSGSPARRISTKAARNSANGPISSRTLACSSAAI